MFPKNHSALVALPGIGAYTASAMLAFAHNIAHPAIETNIRTVYIHHFFADKKDRAEKLITDKQILELVTKTMPTKNIRQWYWALMDYGTHLKQTLPRETLTQYSARTKAYKKQSKFKGSFREQRATIISLLTKAPRHRLPLSHIATLQKQTKHDLSQCIETLIKDKMVHKTKTHIALST